MSFDYVRKVDVAAFDALAADERYSQKLLDRKTGADRVAVSLIRTPPGGGSPEGLHTHAFEQIFYVLAGVMNIEVDGQTLPAEAGSLVIFPEGMPHRNWNAGDTETLHLAINVPAPELGVPAARPVS